MKLKCKNIKKLIDYILKGKYDLKLVADLQKAVELKEEIQNEKKFINSLIKQTKNNELNEELNNLDNYNSSIDQYIISMLSRANSLELVGILFGVSRERIRQIELTAFKKIKHPVNMNKVRDLYDYLYD